MTHKPLDSEIVKAIQDEAVDLHGKANLPRTLSYGYIIGATKWALKVQELEEENKRLKMELEWKANDFSDLNKSLDEPLKLQAMTTGKLIELLSAFPKDLTVILWDQDKGIGEDIYRVDFQNAQPSGENDEGLQQYRIFPPFEDSPPFEKVKEVVVIKS